MHWHVDEDSVEEVKPEPPSLVINSDDGTLWIAPAGTPPSMGVSASLGHEWRPLGVLTEEDPQGPQIPHVSPLMVHLQDQVNQMITKQEIPPTFQTADTATYEFTVNMLEMNDQVRELFFGPQTLEGLRESNDAHWLVAQRYMDFRPRCAAGYEYISGPR